MSRLLSLCSQRCSCGKLTRCVECVGMEYNDCGAEGMMEVRVVLLISRAASISCSFCDPLDSLTRLTECDEQDGCDENVKKMKARALGYASCLIRWGKHMSHPDLLKLLETQANTHDPQCSAIEQRLGSTPTQTIELLKQAADLGDSFALESLGACSFHGHVLPQNKENSVRLFQQASDLGNTDAMVNLGGWYDIGRCVSQDKTKAFQLYQQAADLGNSDAMLNLGVCYEKGYGLSLIHI